MLKISSQALQEMIEHCRKEYPNEACGVLVGKTGTATGAIPVRNIHASPSSYEMDPKEQLQIQRRLRQDRLEQMAIYHSHVATEAYPSRRDVDRATAVQDFFDGHYVLVSLQDPMPQVRAFQMRDYHVKEVPVVEV